jgi:hypothetical protein
LVQLSTTYFAHGCNGIAHSKNEADGLGVFEGNMQEAGIGIASALNQ